MSDTGPQSRDDLLARTPEIYLAGGYLGPDGTPRPELQSMDATAAATQLLAAEASPQELSLTYEGIRQLLPLQEGGHGPDRLDAALDEALDVVARAIQQPNNEGLVQWIGACAEAVSSDADIPAFLHHVQSVVRQYALIAALQPPDPPGPSYSSSPPSASAAS